MDSAAILALEAVTASGWPAEHSQRLGGWLLNATAGFSSRINSCWPLAAPDRPTDAAIADVEAFYAARGLPALFKIARAGCEPADLPARLAARGYAASGTTLLMVGPSGGAGDARAVLADAPDAAFARVFSATTDDPAEADERLGALSRVPAPRAMARIEIDGVPAAIGAACVNGDWAGVFAMRTDPAFRRRGLGRGVFAALSAWAAERAAGRMWLQVEADNDPAIELYRGFGFQVEYAYDYWTRRQAA